MNETVTALPPLLNEQLIERALRNYHNINDTTAVLKLKNCNFKCSPASAENFCSDIYQVNVTYELNGNAGEKSFIVKIMKPEIAELGSNEEIMFQTVLPAMERILNATNESASKLHARCLVSESKKVEFYVLENLNSLGYYSADRCKGLDLAHALLVMRKIAQFHAASMMFAKKVSPQLVLHVNGLSFNIAFNSFPM